MLEERVGPTGWHLEAEGGLRPQQLRRGQSTERGPSLAKDRLSSPELKAFCPRQGPAWQPQHCRLRPLTAGALLGFLPLSGPRHVLQSLLVSRNPKDKLGCGLYSVYTDRNSNPPAVRVLGHLPRALSVLSEALWPEGLPAPGSACVSQYPIPEMGLLGEKLSPSRLETWEMQGRVQGSGAGS